MSPLSGPSFTYLLYRYWFFGWLFRDAQRGNQLEREAALRHNRERAVWLPTYMRRWILLGSVLYGMGGALEWIGLTSVAPLVFVPACFALPVLAVATAGWLVLRGPNSAYISPGRRRH